MRSAEYVASFYFLYLAAVCWLRPLPASRRLFITAVSLLTAAGSFAASRSPGVVREWAPLIYIFVGYYLTGRLFVGPSLRLEAWLMGWDHRLFGDPTTRFAGWPAWFIGYLDIVYMFCFLLLPAGLIALLAAGRADQANHYWTMVLAADLGAFAPLSVFQTRPPWMLEPKPALAARSVHHMASYVVENATIRVNTFPSGHVAVSFAVALALIGTLPVLAGVMLVLAATIGVACVVGRYHYAVDVVTGAMLAALVWGATALTGT